MTRRFRNSVAAPLQTLTVLNRQTDRRVDLRLLRRIIRRLLQGLLEQERFDLGICLVSSREITRLNETFLHHKGRTDVITFDYSKPGGGGCSSIELHGELFVCVEVAVEQAREFRTTWPSELMRYIIHGVLHLIGFHDSRPAERQRMKRQEARLLAWVGRRYDLKKLRYTTPGGHAPREMSACGVSRASRLEQ